MVCKLGKKWLLAMGCLLLGNLPTGAAAESDYQPIADPAAVVIVGNARFTVLTPEMIRIQYSSQRLFEDRATFGFVNRRLPVPAYTVEQEGMYTIIKTEKLTLRYRNNAPIRSTSKEAVLCVNFQLNDKDVTWYPDLKDTGNLKGTTRTLDGALGDSQRSNLERGLLSRNGWVVIDESSTFNIGDGTRSLAFDDNVDGVPWVSQQVDATAIDWYFMGYGHDYKKALGDYTQVGGKQPMPPLYALGYWYSRYWKYSQRDYVNLVSEIQANHIPLDVMILDMDWHTEGWTGWTWDKSLFSDPKALLSWMHGRKLKVSLNLHPADGVDSDEDGFEQLRTDMGLPSTTTVVPWTLEKPTFYHNMFKDIIHPLENYGVDFWWIDWQQNLMNPRMSGLSETFWCNHVFYNDMKQHRPEVRPLIFHRWGGLGSHRYPIGFSGDTKIDYSTLEYEIYFTSTASNVCFGYWGHDLGGHQQGGNISDPNDPQLYLRWMQFGVFTPIFRSHATNDPAIERRIWKFDNFSQLNDVVKLRYQLIPYIYTASRQAYDTGVSICRPLYYDNPERDEAYRYEDEYMFGDNILVAPIYKPIGSDGRAWRNIWLPEGKWFDVSHNAMYEGGQVISEGYSEEQIPYFYKAGSIIPLYGTDVSNLQDRPSLQILHIIPGADEGNGVLYEDENNNDNYKFGNFATIRYAQSRNSDQTILTIAPVAGYYQGMAESKDYDLYFWGEDVKPQSVSCGDRILEECTDWTYNSEKKVVIVHIKATSSYKGAQVKLQYTSTGIIEKIRDKQSVTDAPIYDLSGRKILVPQSSQVVVKGKKKVIQERWN